MNKVLIQKLIFINFLVLLGVISGCGGLPSGYELVATREDDFHLLKEGNTIVEPTIVDFKIKKDYFVGLRLSSEKLECDSGAGYKIKLLDERIYFILNMNNEAYQQFSEINSFNKALTNTGLIDEVKLDTGKFDTVWNKYSEYYKKVDFTNCHSL